MDALNQKIKLVLSGSGTKYPAQGGAVAELLAQGYEVEAATGISGGSIITAALGCGHGDPESLRELVSSRRPRYSWWDVNFRPLSRLGLTRGARILKQLDEVFDRRLGDTVIPIRIGAVAVPDEPTRGSTYKVFGTEETPDVRVADAVRASISIPWVFEPHVVDGVRYVDGGVAKGFPLEAYGSGEGVFGIRAVGENPIVVPKRGMGKAWSYTQWVLGAMLSATDHEHIEDAVHARMVYVTGPSTLDLDISDEEFESMWSSGRSQVASFLEHMDD